MKYQVGDKILVRPDLEEGKIYEDEVVISDMLYFKGKIVTIEHVDYPNHYRIKEDPDQWHWTDEMFVGKESEEIKSDLEEIKEDFDSNKIYNSSNEFSVSTKENTSNFIIVKSNRLKLLL